MSSISGSMQALPPLGLRSAALAAALALAAGGCSTLKSDLKSEPAKVAGAADEPVVAATLASCPRGQDKATTAELVFGRNIGSRLGVSDDDWRRFIDEDVTPRFPDGLSVIDVQGQWRASDGSIVREPSKVLYLVLDGGPDDPMKITNIREAYKRRFRQESVLLVTRSACVSF